MHIKELQKFILEHINSCNNFINDHYYHFVTKLYQGTYERTSAENYEDMLKVGCDKKYNAIELK